MCNGVNRGLWLTEDYGPRTMLTEDYVNRGLWTEDYGSKVLTNTPPVSLRQLLYINSLIAAH